MDRRAALAIEFAAIFVLPPALLYLRVLPNVPIPALIVAAGAIWTWLRRDGSRHRPPMWKWPAARGALKPVLLRSLAIASVMPAAVWLWRPELVFAFVRRAPAMWVVVMLLYPLVSVYPQELIWRVFLFHRYGPLFGGKWAIVAASALAFGFAHIAFGNWLAVVLSTAGGFLFARTYARTGSLALVTVEHAILGDAIFTSGLGQFFFHGARR